MIQCFDMRTVESFPYLTLKYFQSILGRPRSIQFCYLINTCFTYSDSFQNFRFPSVTTKSSATGVSKRHVNNPRGK